MSLDVYLEVVQASEVYSANITHNLGGMADVAGIYKCLWRPEEIGISKAGGLIPLLEEGLRVMRSDPCRFRRLSAPNGWGTYEQFVPWLERYIAACREYPEAMVRVSR